jgi:hypothetical protein
MVLSVSGSENCRSDRPDVSRMRVNGSRSGRMRVSPATMKLLASAA